VCQARQSHALELAQTEFSVLPAIRDTASLEEVAAAVLKYEPLIGRASSWLKDATAFLHKRAVGGDTVPGFELVAKRSTRVWANQEKAKLALIEAGLKESDLYTDPELKSPAQIEKLVGKKNVPDGLTVSVSSGYNLVPSAGNTKPVARLDPANEFETLDNL
jgi:hypothetical protein